MLWTGPGLGYHGPMLARIRPIHVLASGVFLAALLFGLGWMTRENPSDKPYLSILGGGFVISYPVTDVYYGFAAKVEKPVAIGSIIEAEFEDPAGGPPMVLSVRTNARTTRYSLRSPSVRGVEAGRPYRVVIRLYDFRHERLIEAHERTFSSRIADRLLPLPPDRDGPELDDHPFTSRG